MIPSLSSPTAKNNLAHLLLQEASDISRVKKVSSDDLKFWKLAVSSTIINFMHPSFEARLSKLFTESQLDAMKGHMIDQKKAFQGTTISELIDSLFDSLLLYQLDSNTDSVIDFIDGEKYMEKNKQSERYKLLKLIWIVIIDFERLRAPNATETLFSSNFEMLLALFKAARKFLTFVALNRVMALFLIRKWPSYIGNSFKLNGLKCIMFQDHSITIESGETVPDATSRAAAINEHSTSDSGRRIDVLVHNACYGIRNEYCCIKFKKQNARTKLLTYQQSKSIRINSAILNDLTAKTNVDDIYLIYMDFWCNDGYIAGMKRFENIHLVDHIGSLHLPVNLVELEDFRSTIKYLYRWRQHVLKHSQKISLGVFKKRRKSISNK